MTARPVLVFVYNADSGFLNTLLDIGHKLVSPATYSCRLCVLTHSTFHMRQEWREFVDGLDAEIEFLHRDELAARHGELPAELPAIFRRVESALVLWTTSADIRSCDTVTDLRKLIESRLKLLSS